MSCWSVMLSVNSGFIAIQRFCTLMIRWLASLSTWQSVMSCRSFILSVLAVIFALQRFLSSDDPWFVQSVINCWSVILSVSAIFTIQRFYPLMLRWLDSLSWQPAMSCWSVILSALAVILQFSGLMLWWFGSFPLHSGRFRYSSTSRGWK